MPRRRLRREPINDPGGLETIFENTNEEIEEEDSLVKRFVLGRNARKRVLHTSNYLVENKAKDRQRRKMMKKYDKPLNLNPLTPRREANLNQLLEEGLPEEEEREGPPPPLLPPQRLVKETSIRELKCKFYKEIEEADALLGPLPFLTLNEQVHEVRTVRKSSRFLTKYDSNKENICGSIFEEKEVRIKKRRSTLRISTA
ncbi:unnamed protein product [Lepeophtheirus salmonis]|uniref:(salmon louse) hypothetical protein n=1 Tax=Lepeophtheirus salmonis TaxID=72036 RepID=A0A7R8CG84_LEPSM|nr:unnamed protein product [Lepeophtheirus salmonis]CAF2766517.1 unnamed protein product [Lepeophtheirus salmonis]